MMNIGDGLTLQSRTVEGKTTSGIFFVPNTVGKAHNTVSGTRNHKNIGKRFVKPTTESTKTGTTGTKEKENYAKSRKNFKATGVQSRRQNLEPKSVENDVVFINNNSRVADDEKTKTKATKSTVTKKPVPGRASNNPNVKVKPAGQSQIGTREIKVDTNFVTLTQDQLNTILSLVKTKQDIDVATVINKDQPSKEKTSEKVAKSSEGKRVEPSSVPGLDLDDAKSIGEDKDNNKESDSNENVSKLLDKLSNDNASNKDENPTTNSSPFTGDEKKRNVSVSELSGTLGGYGSRDRERSRLEDRRRKWIEGLNEQVERKKQLQASQKQSKKDNVKSSSIDLTRTENTSIVASAEKEHQSAPNSAADSRKNAVQAALQSRSSNHVDQIHEALPSAIRSSFFLGEALPRDHAYSAKKKQEQQAWREELENQIREKEAMKSQKKEKEIETDDVWSRHFDTMNSAPTKTVAEPARTPEQPQETIQTPPKQSPRNPAFNSDSIAGIYLGEHTTNSNTARAQSNYLRTMTSLLDPSQIDAMEVKRQKQQEHRRIIAEQVEEKRRLKEKEKRAKKEEEEQEERRLMEERRELKNQFEKEKTKHQIMEEKRDRQTQELYQQMKEAEAAALKEKFERRQQSLKNHGHDTSRLERTHQHALEKSMHTLHPSSPLPEQVPPLNINDDHHQHQYHESPRAPVAYQSDIRSPVTLMTGSSQQPIKLEISVNQKQSETDVAVKSVQTDDLPVGKRQNRRNDTLLDILTDSDAETQYMELPYPSGRQKINQKKSKTKRDQEARNRHYERYSRNNAANGDAGQQTKRGPGVKPKWGAGTKKKSYVSNSDRYLSKREREERENRLRRREELLLADQSRNNADRLVAARKVKSEVEFSDHSLVNVPENKRPSKRGKERSRSPHGAAMEASSHGQVRSDRHRPSSPPVPALMNQMRSDRTYEATQTMKNLHIQHRPETAISVTTDQAKYQSSKHSASSPVPDTDDFVEYRRSDVILDPNQPQTRPSTEKDGRGFEDRELPTNTVLPHVQNELSKDPLLNSEVVRQKERQDRILKEISILRQGLLLKQREVASYPVAMTAHQAGKNLPERTNDGNLT